MSVRSGRPPTLPAFADVRLCDLDTPRIDAFRSQLLATGRAANTVKNILNVLSAMLTKADDLGWIDRKPKIVRPKPDPHDYNWIDSLDDLRAFLRAAHAEEERLPLPELGTMYATSVYTGARAGEVAALRWIEQGGDLFRLQTILGHQNVQVTVRYGHMAPDEFAEDHGRLGSPMQPGMLARLMSHTPEE